MVDPEISTRPADASRRGRRRRASALPTEHWSAVAVGPRVLVECDDPAMTWAMERVLEDAGYEVAACPGPSKGADCSLVATGTCDLTAGSDVVVHCLGPDQDQRADVLARTAETFPATPMVVAATPAEAGTASLPPAAVVLRVPWQGQALLTAVDQALATSPDTDDARR